MAIYDYGVSSAGSLHSTVNTTYAWNSGTSSAANYLAANLLDLVSKRTITNAAAASAAETDLAYDESSYSPTGLHGDLTSLTKVNQQGASPTLHAFYNSNGEMTKALDGNGNATSITAFQCGGSLAHTITNPLGQTSQYTFDCGTGVLTQYQDANDIATNRPGSTYFYDAVRNPTLITHPDGGSTTINYNYYALPLTVTKTALASPDPSIVSSTVYDGFLKPTQSTLPNGATVETTYDLLGRVHTVTNPHAASVNAATDGTTTTVYDALGRAVQTLHPDGTSLWNCFNGLNNSQQPNCQNPPTGLVGTWIDSADETGKNWQKLADAEGELRQVIEPGSLGTTYSYDVLGNLTLVNQTGVTASEATRSRTFTYNSLSQLLTSLNPETGTICYGQVSGGICNGNGYDLSGNSVFKTDARGVAMSYQYDALNRLTSKTGTSTTYYYFYDGKDDSGHSSGAPNALGRLTLSSNGANVRSTYTYDAIGRLTAQAGASPGVNSSTIATYDLAGNRTSLGYPDGRTVKTGFDAAGHINGVTYSAWSNSSMNQSYFAETNGYDSDGHLINASFGNGVPYSAGYDNRERSTSLSYGTKSSPLWSKQFAWMTNSNLQSQTDMISGVQRQFSYDNLSRLTLAQDVVSGTAGTGGANAGGGSASGGGGAVGTDPGASGAVPWWTNPDESNLLGEINATNLGWSAGNGTLTVNSAVAPDGSTTAATLTATSTGAAIAGSMPKGYDYVGETMAGSVWLKSASGTLPIHLFITGYTTQGTFPIYTSTQVQVTTSWQQFQLLGLVGSGASVISLQIGGGSDLSANQSILIWNPMLEDKGTAGTSVTNYAPHSQRFSTWGSNGPVTVADSQILAPDGTNTASTLTVPAGANLGTDYYVTDTLANPAPFSGVAVTGSVWLKVPSNSSQVLLKFWEVNPSGGTNLGAQTITLTTTWQRFQITATAASALSTLIFQVGGSNSFLPGMVIHAWGAQVELASAAGPYVATDASPVTLPTTLTNLIPYSQQLDGASWIPPYQATVAVNSDTAPDGTATAATVTTNKSSSSGFVADYVSNAGLYDKEQVTASIYLRSTTGLSQINLVLVQVTGGGVYDDELNKTVTLNSIWQRFQVTGTLQNGLVGLQWQIGGGTTGAIPAGQSFEVWGAQVELNANAGPYVTTNDLPIITGSELVNILPNSQSLTSGSWSGHLATVTPNADTAPDGTHTAAIFKANATGESLTDTTANPSLYDGETVTASVYLRSTTGVQPFGLYLTENGESGLDLNINQMVTLTSSWQRFEISGTLDNGLTSLVLQLGAGQQITNGESFEIWGPQLVIGNSAGADSAGPGGTATNVATGQQSPLVAYGLNESYTYDSFGNLKQNGSFNSGFTANNQMVGYSYDAAGNLLSDGYNVMTWDAENRLATAAGATYIYDAEGNRVEKQGSSVVDTVYFGGQPIARYSGGQWTDLIYGPTGLLAEVPGNQTATPVYRMTDHLGNVVGNLLADGSYTNPLDYRPFGGVFSGTTNDPLMFTGKERDTESGLDYFGARYYASNMGRWMSPDWAEKPEAVPYSDLANPQSLNLYGYVNNNPLSQADADGHYFVVSAAMQQQVQQYISTLLRTPQGAATINAIASSSLPVSFGLGTLPSVNNGNGSMSITAGTTVAVPGGTPGAIGGANVTLDNSNISTISEVQGKSDFQVGLTAFTHEDQHVTDILGAKTFQGAAAAGAAGDAPSQPGANNTTGGTAEGRAQQIVGALGGAGKNFQPNAQYDGAAAAILKQGAAQQQKAACSGSGGSCPQ